MMVYDAFAHRIIFFQDKIINFVIITPFEG